MGLEEACPSDRAQLQVLSAVKAGGALWEGVIEELPLDDQEGVRSQPKDVHLHQDVTKTFFPQLLCPGLKTKTNRVLISKATLT